jgi:hypothetical protein
MITMSSPSHRPAERAEPSSNEVSDTADEKGTLYPDGPTSDPAEVSDPSVEQGPDLVKSDDPY